MSDSGQTGVHQGRSVNDMMAEYTDRLQKENTELRARAGRLERAALIAIHSLNGGNAKAEVRDIYDETPQQSLAESEAAAVEKFIESLWPSDQIYTAQEAGNVGYYKRKANEYTNQLRQQATGEN